MNSELDRMYKEVIMASFNVLRACSGICLEGINKTGNLNHDIWSVGRDLKPGPLAYGTGMLTTQL